MVNYADLIGTPFKQGGRNPAEGLDCYGLVMEVYRRQGIKLPDYLPEYGGNCRDMALLNTVIGDAASKPAWRRISGAGSALPVPCVLAIHFGSPPGVINHTGCYIGSGKFIHIRENIGVCVDRINSPAWRHMIEGFYEYQGGD